MRLQIDREKKVIRVEENVNIGKLLFELQELFPNGEWQHYELEGSGKVRVLAPYPGCPGVIHYTPPAINPNVPSWEPLIVCGKSPL